MDLGMRILAEIRAQGRRQNEVAAAAGISRKTLGDIINGKVEPRKETLSLIAEALHTSVDEFSKGLEKEELIARAMPGERPYPAGLKRPPSLGREWSEVLQKALHIVCTLELEGEAEPELREGITNLISRLEEKGRI